MIASVWTDPGFWFACIEVAIGVGFVIFVHELGHFLVAKMCGVKCEKFMIGFDIGGIRLLSYRRGETLYGIGILPLGGYVKMLGQEDNPAALRREMERARLEADESARSTGFSRNPEERPPEGGTTNTSPEGGTTNSSSDNTSSEGAAASGGEETSAEARLYDPRSYLAKSVPQRMAIISAGVIMNMIFAFIFAVIAYSVGVKDRPSVVGGVVSGGAAWQADIRNDDAIEEVAGHKVDNFEKMTQQVVNSDVGHGVPLLVRRPGEEKPLAITVKPQQLGGKPTIGIISASTLQLGTKKDSLVFLPGSAAERSDPPFLPGDHIVKIDGQRVDTNGQLQDRLSTCADKPLRVTVTRTNNSDGKKEKTAGIEDVVIAVPANPMKHFGMTMQMGPIASVQVDSPAAKAGIQPGDLLRTIDGKPVGDPMRLPDEIRKLAGTEVQLGLQRDGKPLELKVRLSSAARCCQVEMPDSPVALSELGAAYFVLNTVASVDPGGPAVKAGLQAGDRLTNVKIIPPPADELKALRAKYGDEDLRPLSLALPFGDEERNWPCFLMALQNMLPGTKVEFTWERGGKEMTGAAAPVPASGWFNPERGWFAEAMIQTERANGFGEALRMGWRETVDSTLFVYRMLHSVSTGKISPRMVSGPPGIIMAALTIARTGLGNFLAFLTLLSANLAVLNFLPIPVLDGGHMALLLYEGIRGKPADERVQEVMTWIGLILLLSLMVWAFGLDLGLFARPGAH